MAVTHLAFDRGARDQGGDRIDEQDIDRVGAHQGIDDLERLLPRVGLRDDEVIDIDAELLGIDRIEGMLGIHESRGAALLLSFSHRVQCERRLARAFRPVDLDDAAARETADRSEEHTSELQSQMRNSYAVFLLQKKTT